ncbi:hypothetical protein ILUMI_04978 [Ignelater luminosus]|uniref:Mutator-like transposase domain-containing protein n=1 Tax=Ignelater luminosus TaxID=2038154 RepID=A0A8K0DBU9_IGNLU|nr:hypothetical protein ILUMI_04978 [Ignelater luminosus]
MNEVIPEVEPNMENDINNNNPAIDVDPDVRHAQKAHEVSKIECTNRVIKNYDKGVYKIQNDTKGVPLVARKTLTKSIIKELTKGVRYAIYNNACGGTDSLKEDIRNSVNHVFDNHRDGPTEDELQNECDKLIERLQIHGIEEQKRIERLTVGQFENKQYISERSQRLTASNSSVKKEGQVFM